MNVRVDLNYPIYDGAEIVFKAPCDAFDVTGLIVYWPSGTMEASAVFMFADAQGNNLGNIDELFYEGAVVKVILDTDSGMAFVQNAATNAYLEERFAGIGGGSGGSANIMFVTLEEQPDGSVLPIHNSKRIASYDMYAHMNDGGIVILRLDETYVTLGSATPDVVLFFYKDETGTETVYEVDHKRVYIHENIFVTRTFFDDTIGDISSALTELHNYAETLKGGGVV